MMNLGNNIKLDILKLVFCLKWEIFASRDLLYQFSYVKRKVKMGHKMTCHGYMLKHQRNCLVSKLKNLSRMDDYHLPWKRNVKIRSRDHFFLLITS